MMTCVEKLCYQFFSRLQLFLFSSHSVWKLFYTTHAKNRLKAAAISDDVAAVIVVAH